MNIIRLSAQAAVLILITSNAWAASNNQDTQPALNINGSVEIQAQPRSQTWSEQQLNALQSQRYSNIFPILQNEGYQALSQVQSLAVSLSQVPILNQIPGQSQIFTQAATIIILTGPSSSVQRKNALQNSSVNINH